MIQAATPHRGLKHGTPLLEILHVSLTTQLNSLKKAKAFRITVTLCLNPIVSHTE
jgi:hypothetical protein